MGFFNSCTILFSIPEVLVWLEQGLPTFISGQIVQRWLYHFNLMLEKFSKQRFREVVPAIFRDRL